MTAFTIPSDLKTLARLLSNRGISTDKLGFYNDPAFVIMEQQNPAFIEMYGAWVQVRARGKDYDDYVRRIVPKMAELVADEIIRDGQQGVCIDASMMMTKFLEEEGVWCFAMKGALSISAPSLAEPTHFWLYDVQPAAGHMWVVAPPFEIVDVALRGQPFTRGEQDLLPTNVVVEAATRIVPDAHEYMSAELLELEFQRRGPLPHDIHFRKFPGLVRSATYFPSSEVTVGTTVLRYAAAGVSLSDAPSLDAITSRTWNGRLAGALYREVLKPALSVN